MTFSDQPERREKEQQSYIYFIDYIEECEGMWYFVCWMCQHFAKLVT